MKRSLSVQLFLILALIVNFSVLFGQSTPALVANLGNVEIVGCLFVTEYTTERYTVRVSEDDMDKYRIAIITLRIQKPAGEELKLAAADVTLHYYYDSKEETAPCDGISVFSSVLDVDRVLKTGKCSPGWLKQTTGTRTTAAATIYVDVAFRQIEPDISQMWVCVAKPVTAEYSTKGWKP